MTDSKRKKNKRKIMVKYVFILAITEKQQETHGIVDTGRHGVLRLRGKPGA